MIREIESSKFIELTKKELKKMKDMKPPEWSKFVKTGTHRKFAPNQEDWWYIRAASIFRKVALNQPIGVSRLRTYYGGKKERGHKPERFRRAGGSHIRKIFQQLEASGLVKAKEKGFRKGRILTEKGQELIKKIENEAKK
jgi:small subunit ribosomal protein S19e